jgi:hypothetical protein
MCTTTFNTKRFHTVPTDSSCVLTGFPEETAISALHRINRYIFINGMHFMCYAVTAKSSNTIRVKFHLQRGTVI